MKLSLHHTKGKSDNPDWTNLGYNWDTVEMTWEEVFELVTVDGHATSAELSSDNRKEANFVSRQLLMVDVDNDVDKNPNTLTIPELLQHEFYNAYGAGFYATHSFRPDHHKFRICFVLEAAETDSSRCRKIIRGLLKVFPAGDKACVDPVRLFYGNVNCTVKEFRTQLLTTDVAQMLIDIVEAEDAEYAESMTRYAGKNIPKLNNELKQRVLDLLKQTFVGSYPIWRNIGWGLKAGGFSLSDFQYVTAGLMNKKTPADAAKVWNSGGPTGKPVTMGSVIHLLKERHGKDALGIYYSVKEAHYSEYQKYSAQMAEVEEIKRYIKELENGSSN